MAYMKFRTKTTPSGDTVMVRIFHGQTYEENRFGGTLVLPAPEWEKLLDAVIYGASQMRSFGGDLEVYFGPDDGGEG